MIFVTVGTHEQQFNRLIEYMDKWAGKHEEDVVMQTGFSTYAPVNCIWQKLFSYKEMQEYINQARIVITHGGPASFIASLQIGKVPIVVPRKKIYNEHVNDHQGVFCRKIEERLNNICVVEDVEKLDNVIENYDEIVHAKKKNSMSNNILFCENFTRLVDGMFKNN